MREEDLPDKILGERVKRITPKVRFLQFLHGLFAATLLGKVDWRPDEQEGSEIAFRAEFGRAVVCIVLCRGNYSVKVVFNTEHGDFSIDGETSYARIGTFKSIFWAVVWSFEVRRMLNRKALPCGSRTSMLLKEEFVIEDMSGHRLFAATLLGKVDWRPDEQEPNRKSPRE